MDCTKNFLDKLSLVKKEDLLRIDGFGETLANNFINYIKSEEFLKLKLKLEQTKLEIVGKKSQLGKLTGETICITGSFDISREEISKLLELQGAKMSSTVTTSTTVLLAGEKSGSKLIKADKLNIRVVNSYLELL
jgi:DNA ligase (NAD+)